MSPVLSHSSKIMLCASLLIVQSTAFGMLRTVARPLTQLATVATHKSFATAHQPSMHYQPIRCLVTGPETNPTTPLLPKLTPTSMQIAASADNKEEKELVANAKITDLEKQQLLGWAEGNLKIEDADKFLKMVAIMSTDPVFEKHVRSIAVEQAKTLSEEQKETLENVTAEWNFKIEDPNKFIKMVAIMSMDPVFEKHVRSIAVEQAKTLSEEQKEKLEKATNVIEQLYVEDTVEKIATGLICVAVLIVGVPIAMGALAFLSFPLVRLADLGLVAYNGLSCITPSI